jgi:competence protein ComEC
MLFASYALGVIASAHSALPQIGACALLCCCIVPIAWWREPRIRGFAAALIAAFVAGAGLTIGALALRHLNEPVSLAEHHVIVDTVAIDRPRASGSGESMRARIVKIRAPAGAVGNLLVGQVALVQMPALRSAARIAGRTVTIRARLSLPSGSRNEGEPAERDILAEQGVSLILFAPGPRDIEVHGDAHGWEAWWARTRERCAIALESQLPPLEATVIEGILWGDRGDLPAALRQEFSDTGTVHVLTTAGLHLGIFAALISYLLLLVPLPRPARAALVVLLSWCYAAMAGLHLPTIRAASMLTAGTAVREFGRSAPPSTVLAAAAFAATLPHPLALLTPSFSMSFACVAGIALLSPPLAALGFSEDRGLPQPVVELSRTSIAVQVALWPLQALYFCAFTPFAVAANMVVVPIVGVIMALGGLLVLATAFAPPLAHPLSNLAWWSASFLIGAVEKFASFPHAHVDMPPPTDAFLIAYWIALGGSSILVQRTEDLRRLLLPAVISLAGLATMYVAPGIAAAFDPRLHVDAIDVGQADCILIRAPGMHAMLVDGGGKLERSGPAGTVVAAPIGDIIATKTLLPFLLRHWVLWLDVVVLTHPHGDHAGGLPVLLSRESVGVVYDSAQLYGGPAYHRALQTIADRRIAYRVARRGQAFDLGPTTHVQLLAPELPLITGTSSDINNNSVVLRVTFDRIAILLTGDAQAEAEERLLSHGSADLRADILKVGHHGSAYSSTPAFLAAVHPRIAIISCGLHNVFGHPSPRTLAALHAAGAMVYRTDLDGGISLITDGQTVFASASGTTP